MITETGLGMARRGKFRQALITFTRAIQLDHRYWAAYRFRGIAYTRLRSYDLAIKDFDSAIRVDPGCVDCLFERGMTKMFAGHLEGALEDLSKCLGLNADFAPAYSTRAGICTTLARYKQALEDIDMALKLMPDNAGYLHNRAVILTAMDRYGEAIENYEQAIKLDPRSGGTYNNLAWLLGTAKDPAFRDCRKAILYAHKALGIGRNGAWMDTLAAAYAECGDFEKAVSAEKEAYSLSSPPNERFLKRIEVYKHRMTYADWCI